MATQTSELDQSVPSPPEQLSAATPAERLLRTPAARSVAAIATVIAALLLRQALVHRLGELPPFITFYPAVLLAALLGGLWSGILATGFSALLAGLWILPARAPAASGTPSDTLGVTVYCAMGVAVSIVVGLYRRNRSRVSLWPLSRSGKRPPRHSKSTAPPQRSADRPRKSCA